MTAIALPLHRFLDGDYSTKSLVRWGKFTINWNSVYRPEFSGDSVRKPDDELAGLAEIEGRTRQLLEHVGIDRLRTHQRDPALQRLALRTNLRDLGIERLGLGGKRITVIEAARTIIAMPAEIAEQAHADEHNDEVEFALHHDAESDGSRLTLRCL